MLTIIADEGIRAVTASVIPHSVTGAIQCTDSIIIWLRGLPVSEGTDALVRPFPLVSEQTNPCPVYQWCVFIHYSLQCQIFSRAHHTGQVTIILSAVLKGLSPIHLLKYNIRKPTGPLICEYVEIKMFR